LPVLEPQIAEHLSGGDLSYRVSPANGDWGAISQAPFLVTTIFLSNIFLANPIRSFSGRGWSGKVWVVTIGLTSLNGRRSAKVFGNLDCVQQESVRGGKIERVGRNSHT
jgi:hypothetical protein